MKKKKKKKNLNAQFSKKAGAICLLALLPLTGCRAELPPLTQHDHFPEKHKGTCLLGRHDEIQLNRAKNFLPLFVFAPTLAVNNFVYPSFSDTNEEPSGLHNSLTRKAAKRALWILSFGKMPLILSGV